MTPGDKVATREGEGEQTEEVEGKGPLIDTCTFTALLTNQQFY